MYIFYCRGNLSGMENSHNNTCTTIEQTRRHEETILIFRQSLEKERAANKILTSKVDDLQIAVESADIRYEMLKQKCMEQFKNFQDELNELKEQNRSRINEDVSYFSRSNEIKTLSNSIEENGRQADDLDLRLQILENTSFNGHIQWKIDNYRKRRHHAIIEPNTALHSAPCFTMEYGYKFRLQVYLDGDGSGKGTHLSLFMVLMESDYDNLLEWPFQKKVKFTLINQQNRSKDLTQNMIPNKGSSSFQKPKDGFNIGSGCPQFISLDRLDLEGFLKDDTLYIDVKVE